jgi:SAM-dependent methyltransferase
MLRAGITVRLPKHEQGLSQAEEYLLLQENGRARRIRFHDYDEIFAVPGLYETVFSDMLRCVSPEVVAELLGTALGGAGQKAADLSVLDLGAGNGLVGKALRGIGVRSVVAVDILEAAAVAALRDRPEVYDRYHVGDVRNLPADVEQDLAGRGINCLVCVAALGFGDIPPSAFEAAYHKVAPDGWVVFNIKESFLNGGGSEFARLIRAMIDDGRLLVRQRHTYQHRLAVDGEPLRYTAIVARKAATSR